MNVYDFAPDLDLSKEVEGSIFGVKGIEGSDGIVYAKVVSCVDVKDYGCERCIFFMIVIRINVYYRVVLVV
ncbi:MAG: hypothetical protein [Bacteriophage sp.]|nr:MAG: hypothetical protein [Bacteriophage sp.]